jgi:hypothetical protein
MAVVNLRDCAAGDVLWLATDPQSALVRGIPREGRVVVVVSADAADSLQLCEAALHVGFLLVDEGASIKGRIPIRVDGSVLLAGDAALALPAGVVLTEEEQQELAESRRWRERDAEANEIGAAVGEDAAVYADRPLQGPIAAVADPAAPPLSISHTDSAATNALADPVTATAVANGDTESAITSATVPTATVAQPPGSTLHRLDGPAAIALTQGSCMECGGERTICPGCCQLDERFPGLRMGCGVDLACPQCLGWEFALIDRAWHKRHYWDPASDDEQRQRDARVAERCAELGYTFCAT